MYVLEYAKAFERDAKAYYAHGGTEKKLLRVLSLLENGESIPSALHDHALKGKMRGLRELHVEPDWLLVYEKDGEKFRIVCLRLVTHKQLQSLQ